VVEADVLQVELVRQAVLVVVVQGEILALLELLELQIQAVAAAVAVVTQMAVLAALGLSSSPFQHHDTQAQPQVHQLSQQAAQIQF
jgi:hypothetical protein